MKHPLIRSRPLDPTRHDATKFTCGVDELDEWLQKYAGHAASMGTANTYVWTRSGEIVGYYSLAAHLVARDQLPAKLGRGGPDPIPAVLIGKLAVHRSLRGNGAALLADALTRIGISTMAGPAARLIVVDAIDRRAAEFYRRQGFSDVSSSSRTLVMKSSTARRLVDEFTPS